MKNKIAIFLIFALLCAPVLMVKPEAAAAKESVFYVNDYAAPEDIEKLVLHNCVEPMVSLSSDGLSVLRLENTVQTHSNASGFFYLGEEGGKNSSIPVTGAPELIFEYRFRMAGHCNSYDYFTTVPNSEPTVVIGGYKNKDKLRLTTTSARTIGTLDQDMWNTVQVVFSNKDGSRKIYLNGDFVHDVSVTDEEYAASKYSVGGYKSFKPHFVAYMKNLGDFCEIDYVKVYKSASSINAEKAESRGNLREVYVDFDSSVFRLSPSMFKIEGNRVVDAIVYDASENIVRLTLENELEYYKKYTVEIDGVSNYGGYECNGALSFTPATSWASVPEFIQNGVVVSDYEYTDLPISVRGRVENYHKEAKDFSLYLAAYGYKEGNVGKELLATDMKTVTIASGEGATIVTDGVVMPSGVTEVKAFVWEKERAVSKVGTAGKADFEIKENGIPDFGGARELGYASFAKKTGAASTGLTKFGYRTYVAMIGTPGFVFEFDTHTGAYLGSYESGSGLQHAIKVGSDGKVYTMITASPDLYVFDPETRENKLIKAKCCQGSSVWSMHYGGDNDKSMLYMPVMSSSYTTVGTSVVEYDIDNGTVKAYDGFDIGCKYAHTATGDDKYVYLGSADGADVATISRMNKETGVIETWENDTTLDPGSCSFLKLIGDKIFTRFGSYIIVLDRETMKRIDMFAGGRGQGNCISDPDPDNPDMVYYNSNDGKTIDYYNLKTGEKGTTMTITTTYGNPVRWDFGRWIPDKDGKLGIAGIGGSPDAPGIFHVNIRDKILTHVYCDMETDMPGVPTRASFFYMARNDILYVGGYEAGLNGFNMKTNTPVFAVENGNQHGMTMVNGKLFGGSYGNDCIYMYDPNRRISSTNPKKIGSTPGVCRYYHASDTNAGFGLISGIADYGGVQGSVILVTYSGTAKMKSYVGVIPGENIMGVAYKDGYIYAGSSTRIALHEEDEHEEAHIAKIDAKTGETVLMTAMNFPGLPKTTRIGEIAIGPDGLLYGKANAGHTVFALNPENLSLVRYKTFCPDVTPAAGNIGDVMMFGMEGNLYACIDGAIHCINPETFESEVVWAKGANFHLDNDGNVLKRSGGNSNGNKLDSVQVNSRQRLDIMIKNAEKYYKQEDYSAKSWAVFAAALKEAKEMNISEAYLPDVKAMARKLGFAIKDLRTVWDEENYNCPFI